MRVTGHNHININININITHGPGAMLLLCCACLLTGCATGGLPAASTDFNARYDFSGIRSFGYLPWQGGPASPTALSGMEVERMHQAFRRALEARGWTFTDNRSEADILASWHLVTRESTSVRGYDASTAYLCWGCGPAVSDKSSRDYTQGTLIFDLVDPDLRKSVWRGVMQSEISPMREAQGQQERFNAVAERMLEAFPPPGAAPQ